MKKRYWLIILVLIAASIGWFYFIEESKIMFSQKLENIRAISVRVGCVKSYIADQFSLSVNLLVR